jgi:transcriptional regulator with XRE-family HTH domain
VSGHTCPAMTVGRWIREQREALGWSQDDLAFRSHVSPRLIGRYERGEGEPNQTNLDKITDALGKPLPWAEDTNSNDRSTGRNLRHAIRGMSEETSDVALAH